MKQLTKAEDQVMQAVWKIKGGSYAMLWKPLPPPKPHQNTIAAMLKILAGKEFVGITVIGRQHRYHPLVTKRPTPKPV